MDKKNLKKLIEREENERIEFKEPQVYLVKNFSIKDIKECDKYGDIWNKEYDDFDEEKGCTRWIRVDELKKGDKIAVSDINDYNELDNKLNNSLGEITLIPDDFNAGDFNKPLSPEKIGQLKANDRAIYGASLSCGANCLDLGKKCKNSSEDINVISLIKNIYASLNSSSDNLVNLSAFDLCFLTSSSRNSGAINSNLFDREFNENTDEGIPLFIKEEITTFASTINLSGIIYFSGDNSLYLLDKDKLISSANSSACSSVSLDFETICLNRISLESLSINILFINIDKSNLDTILNSDSNSPGIFMHTSVIELPNKEEYISFSVDKSEEDISFEKISSIKELEPQHVYDLAIENTRNFIANDIIAHNTYMYGNTSIDGSTFFVDTTNDRVGIGTTSPTAKLHVNGTGVLLNIKNQSNTFMIINETSGDIKIGV